MALNFPAHQHKGAWIGKYYALEFTPKRLEPYTLRDKLMMNSELIIPLVGVYSGQIKSIYPQGWANANRSCVIESWLDLLPMESFSKRPFKAQSMHAITYACAVSQLSSTGLSH